MFIQHNVDEAIGPLEVLFEKVDTVNAAKAIAYVIQILEEFYPDFSNIEGNRTGSSVPP